MTRALTALHREITAAIKGQGSAGAVVAEHLVPAQRTVKADCPLADSQVVIEADAERGLG
ncbi:hypothetical protein DMY87_09110 [Rhizobium wuzhouense]|uniref:Uncharacterized protein n=1 Tax=Rhizobium wuzhouense TaxID=1986026 RepID=A0ABX5NUG7_9HYPH|nr:hypothetical protein DMY87_09110 [Rhizobium wuzhouense]